jgi:hypothetical protein
VEKFEKNVFFVSEEYQFLIEQSIQKQVVMNKINFLFILVDLLILLRKKNFPTVSDVDQIQDKILNLLVFFVLKNPENKMQLICLEKFGSIVEIFFEYQNYHLQRNVFILVRELIQDNFHILIDQ